MHILLIISLRMFTHSWYNLNVQNCTIYSVHNVEKVSLIALIKIYL